MKIILTTLSFLASILTVQAQQLFIGSLMDKETHAPIAYCNIEIEGKMGTVSNQKGQWILDLKKCDINDTVIISNVMYKSFKLSIDDLKSNTAMYDTIYLSPITYILPEAKVYDNNVKVVEKGINRIKRTAISKRYSFTGYDDAFQNVVYIENFSQKKNKILKSMKLFIHDESSDGIPFRVHVYDNDTSRFCPDKELLHDIVIEKHPNTVGWIEIDLSMYSIKMPENGLFIGIEFLENYVFLGNGTRQKITYNEVENKIEYSEIKKCEVLYIQESAFKERQNLTWHYSPQKGWLRDLPRFRGHVTRSACIAASFYVTKKKN